MYNLLNFKVYAQYKVIIKCIKLLDKVTDDNPG